ncbi:MAG: cyclic nucleotide-binding domain-containing protein [Magnetococcales bacterium]|nr:cyclic nucleotide-binding domain-containing protein [Magnetococcales bacterium]
MDKIPFFKPFSDQEREELAAWQGAGFEKFGNNEPIINEGEKGDTFFVLIKGSAHVFKKPFMDPIAFLKPGNLFGEIAFLSPRARTTSIIAMEETFVLRFSKQGLASLACSTREKLKDQLIVVLIQHLDGLRQVIESTKTAVGMEMVNPFEEAKREEEEVREELFYEGEDGLKLTYLGKSRVQMEKDGKRSEVELVALSDQIPGKYLKAIEAKGLDPKEYMYAKECVIPREAVRAWNRMLVAVQNQVLERQRKIDAYQSIEGLYS